jgi:hypothetical protein
MSRIIENPDRIKKAEIVVGIPSYREADSIEFVVSMVDEGLSRFFRRKIQPSSMLTTIHQTTQKRPF